MRLYVLPFLALAGQEPTDGKMIQLRVTVNTNGDGAPVILKREDLRLLENDKPQELLDIRQENDSLLSLAIRSAPATHKSSPSNMRNARRICWNWLISANILRNENISFICLV